MPAFHVVKSKIINAPLSKVHDTISDFHTWPEWSPWLMAEPQAQVNIQEDGKHYSWEGSRVGSGNMTITKEDEHSIYCDLMFLKPWKSKAKTYFKLSEVEGGTKVEWNMDSSLPWFMFMMKKMMVEMIGNDYTRGMNLLKDYVEDGKVHSKLVFHGERSIEGGSYVGIKREMSMDDATKKMGKDFEQLGALAAKTESANMEKAFCIYHKWDFVGKKAVYTAGLPVDGTVDDLPEGANMYLMPATKVYQIEHIGPYEHLGNAWSAAYSVMRNKEFKYNKKLHPFETYGNSPQNTDPKELRTFINFPMK